MRSLVAVATLIVAAFALEPALAQEAKKAENGKETVAGLPILPNELDALLEAREKWGTEPAMSTAEPGKGAEQSDTKPKSKK